MMTRRFALSAVLLAALAACQPAAPAGLTDADRAAIRAADENFTKMAMAADYAGLVAMAYTDDAMFMAPNAPAATGHAAIQAAMGGFPPISNFTITSQEIEGTAEMAYARGTYSMTLTPPGAAPIPDSGKFVGIWRKQADGSWKMTRDIFNSDLPLPAPAPAPAGKK